MLKQHAILTKKGTFYKKKKKKKKKDKNFAIPYSNLFRKVLQQNNSLLIFYERRQGLKGAHNV